jgi:hypothetical protein
MVILILVAVVLLTGGAVFLFSERIKSNHKMFSTFSAAVVATLIFVHIIPDIYSTSGNMKWLGAALLGGLILQLFLEKITHGVEHNHEHSHAKNHKSILIGVMLGLGVHAMIESMPILMEEDVHAHSEEVQEEVHDHDHDHDHGHDHGHNHDDHGHHHISSEDTALSTKFISAVMMHKVPVTMMLSLFLLSVGVGTIRYFLLIGIFALMTPLGAYLGKVLMDTPGFSNFTTYLVAISTGMLLHIITSILFEHGHSRKENNMHILLIVAGIGLGILLF